MINLRRIGRILYWTDKWGYDRWAEYPDADEAQKVLDGLNDPGLDESLEAIDKGD